MRLSALAIVVAVITIASATSTVVEPEPCKIAGGRRCEYSVEPPAAVAAIEPAIIKSDKEPEPCRGGFGRQCEYL
ncbi:hypothetical protein CPC16_004547, partial [Podila verticillata]